MNIFNEDIAALRAYIQSKQEAGQSVRRLDAQKAEAHILTQFHTDRSPVVFKEDTWLELGHPEAFSTAPVLVTRSLDLVNDGHITLIGPDMKEISGSRSFGQILLIASEYLADEDYRKLNTHQYELELKGYMIKAMPSSLALWSRVSRKTVDDGFSFGVLGNAMMASYRRDSPIQAMEVVFITSSKSDVESLKGLHEKAARIIAAMNKMIEEMSFDCSSCEYLDVCGDVRQLGALREKLMRQRERA